MTLGLGHLAIVAFFPLSVLVPGFVALRRVDLPDEARLVASVGVSLAVLYAISFLLFGFEAGRGAIAAVAVALVALAAAQARHLVAFLGSPAVASLLLHWGIFAAFVMLLNLSIRNFSGGMWAGDWIEHYERSAFFLGGVPLDVVFTGDWPLTARPPLDNLVTAWFLRLGGGDFTHFQVAKALLASLQWIAAAGLALAIAPAEGRSRRVTLVVLALLFCLSPAITRNATYTWTRALTNFFLLGTGALLVDALRTGQRARRLLAYLLLGLGFVTHYSVVPYLLALAAVELRLASTRRLRLRDGVLSLATFTAAAAPWLLFALHHFGFAATFLSPSTVSHHTPVPPLENLLRILGNVRDTLIPHPFRPGVPLYEQTDTIGYLRDYAYLAYQSSLPTLAGSLGGFVAAGLLVRDARRGLRQGRGEMVRLVGLFLGLAILIGIAVNPGSTPHGHGHICLQPIGAAALAYLAARWADAPAWARGAILVGTGIDAVFGVGMHVRMERLTPFDLVDLHGWDQRISDSIAVNFDAKTQYGFAFLGDQPAHLAAMATTGAVLATLTARAVLPLLRASREA